VGLRRALVDRARVIETVSTGAKVDGRKVSRPVEGPWFPARLTLRESPEQSARGRTRVAKRPELLADYVAEDGTRVELEADQRVEVDSADLGRGTWQVDGSPEFMRRRRGPVGWLATLLRVDEPRSEA
jgi:hypothetical protein